jgi:hypothetical protein
MWAAAVGVAIVGAEGCITTPPPDLLAPPPRRPTILHSSVCPPADVPLVEWPADGNFIVPVEPGDPEHPRDFSWDAFVDFDPSTGASPVFVGPYQPTQAVDGGIIAVVFNVLPPPPAGFCHRVEFLVAHAFNLPTNGIASSDRRFVHTPDSVGGDIVTWLYTAGAPPGGCPAYDAGALQDGAFPPPTDGPSDGVPIVNQDAGK